MTIQIPQELVRDTTIESYRLLRELVAKHYSQIESNCYCSKRQCCMLLKLKMDPLGLATPDDPDMIDPVTFGLNRAPFTLSDGYNYDIHAITGLVKRSFASKSTRTKSPILQDHELVPCNNLDHKSSDAEGMGFRTTVSCCASKRLRPRPGTISRPRFSSGRRNGTEL